MADTSTTQSTTSSTNRPTALDPTDATGATLLRAIADGRMDPPPAAVLLGLDLLLVADGLTRFGFTARPEIGNPDSAHGGVLAAIVDFAVSTAVWTQQPIDARIVTADLHVSFLRSIELDGAAHVCTGRVVHTGRSQANATAEIRSPAGELEVVGMATCRVLPAERRRTGT